MLCLNSTVQDSVIVTQLLADDSPGNVLLCRTQMEGLEDKYVVAEHLRAIAKHIETHGITSKVN